MPDINDLGLPEESVGEVDYTAPEPGSFPPQLKPGVYNFVFDLMDDPFDKVEIGEKGGPKKAYLQVIHKATTTVQEPDPLDGSHMVDHEVTLNFQRVNFYKHPKMANSSAGDLIRALDLRVNGNLTPQAAAALFKEVAGRRSFTAEVGWRVFCMVDNLEISTFARKKKIAAGEQVQWPKDKDGNWVEMAECPKCHQKMYGNAEISRYKLPHEQGEGQAA